MLGQDMLLRSPMPRCGTSWRTCLSRKVLVVVAVAVGVTLVAVAVGNDMASVAWSFTLRLPVESYILIEGSGDG